MATKAGKSARNTPKNAMPRRERFSGAAAPDVLPQPGTRNNNVVAGANDRDKTKKREKLVRDTFRMPAGEFALIGRLKKRCLSFGVVVKKSELLRTGLAAINQLTDERLVDAVKTVVSVTPDPRRGNKARKAGVEGVVRVRPDPRREKKARKAS